MKKSVFALLAVALFAGPALAEEAAAPAPAAVVEPAPDAAPVRVRSGQIIFAADDSRIGLVDRVSQHSAFIMVRGGRLVPVPLSSLSRQNGRLVSTLTLEQLTASN
jgi:hypothetical protein